MAGAAVGIRTPNLLIRSQMLYPIELRLPFSKEEVRTYSIISEMENKFFTIHNISSCQTSTANFFLRNLAKSNSNCSA